MPETLTIDGFGPLPVYTPATVAEACALVKQRRAAKQAVYPVGGRTQLDFGLVPSKPGLALDMTALNKVIDYPARDMTITVQAGITLAELQTVLATEGQWLPLDAPHPERSTLGGLVATNTSGPRRLGYGTLRDFVIGITFISDNGDEIHGGGRVVKNVAGYDLMKLHTGALGTLGVITQLTLKVRPKPEASRVLMFDVFDNQFGPVLETIRRSASRPVAFGADGLDNWLFAVGFEEKQITLDWQIKILRDELNQHQFHFMSEHEDEFWQGWIRKRSEDHLLHLAKLSVQPTQMEACLKQIRPAIVCAEPLNGIMYVGDINPMSRPELGTMVVQRAPSAWKTPERVFGKPTPAFELMRHIKRTLDPDDVFNPGRMFV